MDSLSLRRPVGLGFLLFVLGVHCLADTLSVPSLPSLYDKALQNYSAGLYTEALDLFLQVQAIEGSYRETHAYIALCAKGMSEQREEVSRVASVEQARGMMALRDSTVKDLSRRGGTHTVLEEGTHSFQYPAGSFMDESLWEAFHAFFSTVPGAWITVLSEPNSLNDREAVLLAERLVRERGFPVERLSLRSRPGAGPGLTVLVSAHQPVFGVTDKPIPGVMVRAEVSEYKAKESGGLLFFLFALTPEKSRLWRLDLLNGQGDIVRSFEGPPTVLTQVRWDGRDEKGRSVVPGGYSARLSVSGWTGAALTDLSPFSVIKEEIPTQPPAPRREEHVLPVHWQHRFVIRFQENAAVPLERERDVAVRVAYLLKINPEKKVHVVGGVSAREKNPLVLAAQRARWVREELVRLGVPEIRIRLEESFRKEEADVVIVFEE
jgi:hypothetical protein